MGDQLDEIALKLEPRFPVVAAMLVAAKAASWSTPVTPLLSIPTDRPCPATPRGTAQVPRKERQRSPLAANTAARVTAIGGLAGASPHRALAMRTETAA